MLTLNHNISLGIRQVCPKPQKHKKNYETEK